MNIVHKKCNVCQRFLPLDAFSKEKKSVDGHQRMCKDCRKRYDLARKEKLKASAEERRKQMEGKKKHCPACGRDLPLNHFYENYKNADGYSYFCKVCTVKKQNDYIRLEKYVPEKRRKKTES